MSIWKVRRGGASYRGTVDAVTRDSAHRAKERLPSARFFPKLPYVPSLCRSLHRRPRKTLWYYSVCAITRGVGNRKIRARIPRRSNEQGKQCSPEEQAALSFTNNRPSLKPVQHLFTYFYLYFSYIYIWVDRIDKLIYVNRNDIFFD